MSQPRADLSQGFSGPLRVWDLEKPWHLTTPRPKRTSEPARV